MTTDNEAFDAKHDLVREQLALIEQWVEELPLKSISEQRSLMLRIVDFLQRYVLVDARWEEEHLFPQFGERAEVFVSEHQFVARWVSALDALARNPKSREGVAFRRDAYKLLGLLEAHMSSEETVATTVRAKLGPEMITTVCGAAVEVG